MASASHSFVTITPNSLIETLSATSAATSNGTKKMRAMVREFGRFMAPTHNYNLADGYRTTVDYRIKKAASRCRTDSDTSASTSQKSPEYRMSMTRPNSCTNAILAP